MNHDTARPEVDYRDAAGYFEEYYGDDEPEQDEQEDYGTQAQRAYDRYEDK